MIYHATIDTNVIVSYFFDKNSVPGIIIQFILDGIIVPLINDEILREYYDALLRNKFPFVSAEVFDFLESFEKKSVSVNRTATSESFIDVDDIVFYEITLTGRSTGEAYLITGNKKHFPKKYFVVTPREMLDIIEQN